MPDHKTSTTIVPSQSQSSPPASTPSTSTATLPADLSLPSLATPYTFPQIIDADHFTITGLARRIRSPTTPKEDLGPLILEATWRLIRHDLSEDIVMRPAFALHMGPAGAAMAEHDRQDHAAGRRVLVELVNSDPDFTDPATLAQISKTLGDLFDDLGQHMARESGEDIPRFCGIIDSETSLRLAREYTVTLCMTPDVVKAIEARGAERHRSTEPLFASGVKQYVNADMAALTELYKSVLESARYDGGKSLQDQIEHEVERLQVGKWLGYNERKALKEANGGGLGKL